MLFGFSTALATYLIILVQLNTQSQNSGEVYSHQTNEIKKLVLLSDIRNSTVYN